MIGYKVWVGKQQHIVIRHSSYLAYISLNSLISLIANNRCFNSLINLIANNRCQSFQSLLDCFIGVLIHYSDDMPCFYRLIKLEKLLFKPLFVLIGEILLKVKLLIYGKMQNNLIYF